MKYLCLFGILLVVGCRLNKDSHLSTGTKPAIVTFLDSLKGSEAIIKDDVEGIFDKVSILEMEIQMKKSLGTQDRNVALNSYTKFLKTQVSNWTVEEKDSISQVFIRAKAMCDLVSPRLFPGGIRLVKVKLGHYGRDVYYTRGNDIMIPENIFESKDFEKQMPIMLHEIFHLISRSNPSLKADLYKMIGFRDAGKEVRLNDNLKKIILTNPDGISMRYVMDLESKSGTETIVPLIVSKFKNYHKDHGAFFDYLNFDLFKIVDKGTYFEVESTKDGNTTLEVQKTTPFFTKIKDNTQYIIHPDEIIADNFMLALLANSKNEYKKFSPDGKQLIDQILARLARE